MITHVVLLPPRADGQYPQHRRMAAHLINRPRVDEMLRDGAIDQAQATFLHSWLDLNDEAADPLVRFASAYRTALNTQPHRATTAAAEALGISRATAIRRLASAREAGLIVESEHTPATARWSRSNADDSWLACRKCRHPWPCPDAETPTT